MQQETTGKTTMAHANEHDYHLLDPSPWPILASISAFVAAVGAIIWMRSTGGGAGLFGVSGPAFSPRACWPLRGRVHVVRDVVIEAETGHHTPVVQIHQRYGMLLFILGSDVFVPGSGPTSMSPCSPTARIRSITCSRRWAW